MCLLNPRASQVHGHELHVRPIYGDMKQPTVNKDPRPARTTSMNPDLHMHHRMLLMWADNASAPLHSHTDWLHFCVNYRDLKKIAVLPLGVWW